MSNRLYQTLLHQMKDVIGRTIGIIDENGIVIACSELSKIGESKQRIREELSYSTDAVIYEVYTYRFIGSSDQSECICFVEGGDSHASSMAEHEANIAKANAVNKTLED